MIKFMKMKKLIITITLILIVFGAYSFNSIPKQENPDLSVPYTIVTIEAPGMSKEEIDSEIIMSFQSDFTSLEDLDLVKVSVYDNYALMIIGFEIGTDNVDALNSEVVSIINNKSFGEGVNITANNDFDNVDILYAFSVDNYEDALVIQEELYTLSEIKVIEISEQADDYYSLVLDTKKLSSMGMSISDITLIIQDGGIDYTWGYVDNNAVITANSYDSIESIENIIIGSSAEGIVKISDVGTVILNDSKNYVNKLNGDDILYLSIQFKDEVDVTKFDKQIRTIFKDYDQFVEIYFAPDDVGAAINEINTTLIIGMVLVLITVLIGLGIRSAITILITFPFTVFSTIFVLNFLGFDLQKISIAGLIISIGIIVDNAIVILDAINANLEEGKGMNLSIENAIKNNSIPVLTSTLTTIVAFTPLLFLPGVAGQMAFTLPLVVIIALIFSYLNSIFIIPIIASKVVKKKKQRTSTFFVRWITKILKYSKTVVVTSFVLLVTSIYLLVIFQPIQLFPTAQKDFIIVDYNNLNSNSVEDATKVGEEIIKEIDSDVVLLANNYSIPSFYSTLARNFKTPNSGRILYKNEGNNAEEIERVSKIIDENFEGVYYDITEIQLNEPGAPIVIQLYDLDKLENVISDLNEQEGIKEVSTPSLNNGIKYVVKFNDAYLMANGIYKSQVEEYIALNLNAKLVPVIKGKNVDSNLYIQSDLNNLDSLVNESFIINGKMHNLKDIISIEEELSPLLISRYMFRESQEISITIESNYSVYTVQEDVISILGDNGVAKVDYEITGEVKLTDDVFASILDAALFAVFTILLILLVQFRDFNKIFIIASAILLSLIGTSLLLIITDQAITFSVLLGVVSLMGIVVNNGILLIDYIVKDDSIKVYEKCINAVRKRTRAIVISNVTTIIGLIPLIIFGDDFFRPMAIALVGGLTLAVPLSLIVVPSLYILTHKEKKIEKDI